MGFGRGTGFTSRIAQLFSRVTIKSGGGKVSPNEVTSLTNIITLKGGGGKATKTETALTETVVLSSGSYP